MATRKTFPEREMRGARRSRRGMGLGSSAPLLPVAAAFAAGIACASATATDVRLWWTLMAVAAAGAGLVRRGRAQGVLALLLVAALGGVRATVVRTSRAAVTWPEGVVSFEAVVATEPADRPATMAMDVLTTTDGRRLKCYVAKDGRSRQIAIGDRLTMRARVERNSDWPDGPAGYVRYLETHGYAGRAYVVAANWQQSGRSWHGLSRWQRLKLRFLCWRNRLTARYRQAGASGDDYAVIAAMTLGDKSAMTAALRDVYAVSGASHVLALSGLHIGIVYTLLSLMVVSRRWRRWAQPVVLVAIWAFVLLVGLPVSVVRAALMVSTYALLSLAGRGRPSLNALALAALCILAVNPDSLADVGFQLSFLAMLAILALQPQLDRLLPATLTRRYAALRYLWGLATVSVAAQVGTAPLVAYYFGRVSTYFLLTNFIVIPGAMAVLALAALTLAVPQTAAALLWVVRTMNSLLTLVATRLPHASIEGLSPTVLQTALVYVAMVCVYLIWMKYDERY